MYVDPYIGGQITVLEAARNIVASGGIPVGITDCLNYGNPEDPEIFWELDQSVQGIADVCNKFDVPVISGNVSLYNEFNKEAIYPSPMIGMVGLIEDISHITTSSFKDSGDLIYLLGNTGNDFNGSEIQEQQLGTVQGKLNEIDLDIELNNQQLILKAIKNNLLKSCHDLSDGGLVAAISESAFENELGFNIQTVLTSKQMFSETQSRYLVTIESKDKESLEEIFKDNFECLGFVTNDSVFSIHTSDDEMDIELSESLSNWKEAIPCLMK